MDSNILHVKNLVVVVSAAIVKGNAAKASIRRRLEQVFPLKLRQNKSHLIKIN
jgi:hypothetical protein